MAETNTRIIEGPNGPYFNTQNTNNRDASSFILDREWIKQAFLTPDNNLKGEVGSADYQNRYWSSANTKFTDSSLGGNIGINARPQYTPYSDIPVPGRLAKSRNSVSVSDMTSNYGMGRFYSESIDDNAQTIYIRCGVPQFNSLTGFFSSAFSNHMSTLARTGRAPSAWFTMGKVAGTVLAAVAMPAITSTMIAGWALKALFTKPTSKFYTLKPTMHNYWLTVTSLVNAIAVNKGILPRVQNELFGTGKVDQAMDSPYKFDQDFLNQLHAMFPDIINSQNGFDVYAVANRAQRLANQIYKEDFEKFDKASYNDFLGTVQKQNQTRLAHPVGEHTIFKVIDRLRSLGYYTSDNMESRLEIDPKIDPETGQRRNPTTLNAFSNFFDAEFSDGAQFAVFKVDHTGSTNSSFSNAAQESDLSQKFNSKVSDARQAKFSFMGGNMMDGVVVDTIENVVGAVGDFVSGAVSAATFGMSDILKNLGSGYIDIPKYWQSSSAQLPRSNYTIQLISPYGNPISQMINIYIPLSMLLAMALPQSTGKQSYTSPYLVQLYDRGRCQIQLGLVESISLTHGVSNLPYTNRGQCMAIDVSFSIMDLSSVLHMPVSTGVIFGGTTELDEDNILMDYLAVLAGQDLYSQMYTLPKAKLNLAKRILNAQRLTSPAYWASFLHEESTTGLLSRLMPVGRAIQSLAAPSSIVVPR